MAFTFEAGDKVELTYKNDADEEKTLTLTVEANYDHINSGVYANTTGAKLRTGKKRSSLDVRLQEDGLLRVKPRFNSNGKGEDGRLVSMASLNCANCGNEMPNSDFQWCDSCSADEDRENPSKAPW